MLEIELLTIISIIVGILVAYRIIVAIIFTGVATRLRGRVSRSEAVRIFIGSLLDTVLGAALIAASAITREEDKEKAHRIIERITADLTHIKNTLQEEESPQIKNIIEDISLVEEKIQQLREHPKVGLQEIIETLEKMEQSIFYLRDKSDDLSLAKDQKQKKIIGSACERKIEELKDYIQEILRKIE